MEEVRLTTRCEDVLKADIKCCVRVRRKRHARLAGNVFWFPILVPHGVRNL